MPSKLWVFLPREIKRVIKGASELSCREGEGRLSSAIGGGGGRVQARSLSQSRFLLLFRRYPTARLSSAFGGAKFVMPRPEGQIQRLLASSILAAARHEKSRLLTRLDQTRVACSIRRSRGWKGGCDKYRSASQGTRASNYSRWGECWWGGGAKGVSRRPKSGRPIKS